MNLDDLIAEAYLRLRQIFHDPEAKPRDKVLAQKELNRMFGLKGIQLPDKASERRRGLELAVSKLPKDQLLALAELIRVARETSRELGYPVMEPVHLSNEDRSLLGIDPEARGTMGLRPDPGTS